jgi:hypothetical protein
MKKRLRPFFSFFGSKYRIGARYPYPIHDDIVEPFAGGAGYATRYSDRRVTLVERDPLIASLWKWLVQVPSADIRAIPDIGHDQTVDDLGVSQEARWLVGFWVTRCASGPRKRPCAWMKDGTKPTSFWGRRSGSAWPGRSSRSGTGASSRATILRLLLLLLHGSSTPRMSTTASTTATEPRPSTTLPSLSGVIAAPDK